MADDAQTIDNLRAQITATLENLTNYMQGTKPPVVQELTLAQRHLEDARMRLGVARTYENGENPLASK